jgi:hypothetical protein
MSFFDSEVVRSEIAHINELQEKLYDNMFKFFKMDREGKLEHVNVLQDLLEKQKVLYTRLSLSDDPEAKKMKENISKSAMAMGLPEGMDMNIIFSNMEKLIQQMKDQVNKTEG